MQSQTAKIPTAYSLKTFIPSLDFDKSKSFYSDLGFDILWEDEALAFVEVSGHAFLLQDFYLKDLAENLVMHLLVKDIEAWWTHISERIGKHGDPQSCNPPQERPWGMKDFTFKDPSGVLWRVAQNIQPAQPKHP